MGIPEHSYHISPRIFPILVDHPFSYIHVESTIGVTSHFRPITISIYTPYLISYSNPIIIPMCQQFSLLIIPFLVQISQCWSPEHPRSTIHLSPVVRCRQEQKNVLWSEKMSFVANEKVWISKLRGVAFPGK